MSITNDQYQVLRLPVRKIKVKVDIINDKESIIGSFDGIAIDGNITMSADSNYRRSGNLVMVFDPKYNLIPNQNSKIWFNKRCGISIGVSNFLGEVIWFNLGRFAITNVSINEVSKTLSCQLADYMAFLDGTLDGTTTHKILIKAGEVTVGDAIRMIVKDLPRVSIENIDIKGQNMSALLPYDLEKDANTNSYEILKELVELYMDYEMFFDENGYFRVKQIASRINDYPVDIFDRGNQDMTISPSTDYDFKDVKNAIYVWGYTNEDTGKQTQLIYKNKYDRENIVEIKNIKDCEIGDIAYNRSEDISYVYNENGWSKLGFKTYPEFCIENIGEKVLVITDDNIWNDEQAKLRCEYELMDKGVLKIAMTISSVPLYNLQINNKVLIKDVSGVMESFLIKEISTPLNVSGEMSINVEKIYY